MLLIGNGCFGELSIILRVTMVCVFFSIFLPGLIAPEFPVSMTLILYYLTCMYKLFYLLVFLVWLIVTVSYIWYSLLIWLYTVNQKVTYTNTPKYQRYMEHTSHHGKKKIEYPTTHLTKLIRNMTPHAYPQHIHKLFTDRHLHLQRSR